MVDINKARLLLQMAGVFYCNSLEELDEDDDVELLQTLNMNDTWAWATAFGQYVEDSELPELASLFLSYGNAGILYYVSEKREQMKSEFSYINRMIQFVRNEEKIKEGLSTTEYAYKKANYEISG